jgi:hypothetical protein
MLLKYHVIYSVWYYPRFHISAVGLRMYYPWIRGALLYIKHAYILQLRQNQKLLNYAVEVPDASQSY